MRTIYSHHAVILVICLFWQGICFSQQKAIPQPHIQTAEFSDVVAEVRNQLSKHGANQILVVIDIDNTLLAMDQDLGSDQWFHWQEGLLKDNPESDQLIATDFAGLLRVQGILFEISGMHPTEPKLPAYVKEIQNHGCRVISLTARGVEFRSASERELMRNGYDFNKSALKINEPKRGHFLPYFLREQANNGLTVDQILTLGKPRTISYANGIVLATGQHKGYVLKTLLHRSDQKFRSIIFVDDHNKNVDRMQEAFRGTEIEVKTFRYSREDGNVKRFHKSDKSHVVKGWQELNRAIQKTFQEESVFLLGK